MAGWIVLGVFALLIFAFNCIPLGLTLAYEEKAFSWQLRVAGRALSFGKKEKSPGAAEEKPPEEKPEEKGKKDKKEKGKQSLADGLGFTPGELLELLRKVLRKLRLLPGKISVKLFRLHFLAAGEDPYQTAMLYGYINAALSLLTAMGKRSFRVFQTDIRTAVDFAQESPRLEARLELFIRIGQLVGLGFAVLFAALGVWLKSRRRRKKEQKAALREARAMLTEEETQNTARLPDDILIPGTTAPAEERT